MLEKKTIVTLPTNLTVEVKIIKNEPLVIIKIKEYVNKPSLSKDNTPRNLPLTKPTTLDSNCQTLRISNEVTKKKNNVK